METSYQHLEQMSAVYKTGPEAAPKSLCESVHAQHSFHPGQADGNEILLKVTASRRDPEPLVREPCYLLVGDDGVCLS